MTKRLLLAVLASLAAAALAGCVVTPAYTVAPAGTPPLADENASEQASEPPPPLPEYDQPPCPEPGYIWTPGVWHWGAAGYYWVPGTWVAPPAVGMLWTPGYWAFAGAVYVFHPGHWGTHVGYYGGINYGHGYYGSDYVGGRWSGGHFEYNTAVSRVNVTNIHTTYVDNTVVKNVTVNNTTINNTTINNTVRASYVGAPGSTAHQPTRGESGAAKEPHYAPTQLQTEHRNGAQQLPMQTLAHNQGHPPVAATPRPSAFQHPEATAAKPGPAYHPQQSAPHGEGHDEHH